ncbi:MAG: AAA family ATPase [Desulfocapsaceae bacterium]|nr:AAA family ATPase [Desulfocapsaceae bacterium]
MKILQIRFQNLNSLAGEWRIDFTHPDYAANGIFAITGPTGSGKTTLLDAFCLALYGRTPRLERITESSNEIMSRHTGVCFSEAVFETGKGRFRCHWSQRRAREQPAARLQHARHEIVDDRTDTVLENKLKDVARVVEEVTGMDFNQFTRSVLLAQGGFAAFLQASSDERAPILEQITGSEIYSLISRKVHQRRGEEEQQLKLLQSEQSAVVLLTAAAEEVIILDIAGKKAVSEANIASLSQAQAGLAWRKGLLSLEEEIAALKDQEEQAGRQLAEAVPERLLLERAQKVRLLDGMYSQLTGLRGQQERDAVEGEKVRQDLATLRLQEDETRARLAEARGHWERTETVCLQDLGLAVEIRALDIKLQEAVSQIGHFQKEKAAADGERETHARLGQKIQAAIADSTSGLLQVRDFLQQHRTDADLLEDLGGLQELVQAASSQAERVAYLKGQGEKAGEAVREAAARIAQAAAVHKKTCGDLAEAESRAQVLGREAADLLAGREPAAFRDELDRIAERLHSLDKAVQIGRQIASLQAERESGAVQQQQAAASLKEDASKRDALAETIACRRQVVEKQEQIVLLAGRIRSLDEERAHLTAGQPCPLCGATDHPYAAAVPAVPEEADAVLARERDILQSLQTGEAALFAGMAATGEKYRQAVQQQEKVLDQLDQAQRAFTELVGPSSCLEDVAAKMAGMERGRVQAKALLQDLEEKIRQRDAAGKAAETGRDVCRCSQQEMQEAAHAHALAAEHCRRVEEEGRSAGDELRRHLDNAARRTVRYGIADISADNCGEVLALLAARQRQWRLHKEKEEQTLLLMQGMEIDREREAALEQKQVAELKRIDQELAVREGQLAALQEDRRARYGDKDPVREETRVAEVRAQAEKRLTGLGEALHRLEKGRAVLDERMGALIRSLADCAARLIVEEAAFREMMLSRGFSDEADYNAARLPDEAIARRTHDHEKLTERHIRSKALLQAKTESLKRESGKELTPLSLEELSGQIAERTAALQALQQEIGRLQGQLQENDQARKIQKGRLEVLENQRQEYRRWQRLHDLIGSSDGKKFRNFAQGITFELMVGHANRSLQKMTDRYILTRDMQQPLELNVIDNYQAGEVRSTKNLSGGESFIVSLALALGLAGMASTVQVDSLFLDEGFGTLDEDSLETALETLAGLQQEGKIIGIISHVPVLQERIATRIEVVPGPAGRSRLQGPGVSARGGGRIGSRSPE